MESQESPENQERREKNTRVDSTKNQETKVEHSESTRTRKKMISRW